MPTIRSCVRHDAHEVVAYGEATFKIRRMPAMAKMMAEILAHADAVQVVAIASADKNIDLRMEYSCTNPNCTDVAVILDGPATFKIVHSAAAGNVWEARCEARQSLLVHCVQGPPKPPRPRDDTMVAASVDEALVELREKLVAISAKKHSHATPKKAPQTKRK